ncbi:hypothetical protein [Marinifilum caeruleilacunae]|uniref:DUF3157 family protein n=1 Tax=Marinifilum caeruleilacunae TaxID=2499076 RepID=A0ABX1X0Y8_9BACT|nr:hypothetical protein [Marinifilum caeruleilacunae]NOU62058.1 hypothetical protein [Marinifilum caeruleilacunae]
MKHILLVAILLFCSLYQADAQMRLKAPDGRIVLLFDNGTWKYEEVKKAEIPKAEIKADAEIAKPILLKSAELESQTVIKGVSEKLSKFSDTKNVVKCDFQLLSDGEKVLLKTNWKIMDEEGFRFFGFITKKSKIDFELSNGESISLQYAADFEPKEYPNYGFTIFKSELVLNQDQIRALQKAYITKSTMQWSRRTEEYAIYNPDYFIRELPKILE